MFNPDKLKAQIKVWATELGFDELRVTDTDLSRYEAGYLDWIARKHQGTMDYLVTHGLKRFRPETLVSDTLRVLSVRKNYLPPDSSGPRDVLHNPQLGYVSRYALGRDYHKVLRGNLQKLAERITQEIGAFGFRAFVDSAPVYETGLAEKAGIGWKGKHSLILNREAGSWFFLGELFIDFALPVDDPVESHCGSCTACITVCPTQAIVADSVVDARRCISYLTIESAADIPEDLRADMGNRIYGCDDCQLVCPWNRFARVAADADFRVRHGLDAPSLVELFMWDEPTFLQRTEGMAIRRIGWHRWLRNVAVALGNLLRDQPDYAPAVAALMARRGQVSEQLDRHIHWALAQQAGLPPRNPKNARMSEDAPSMPE